MEDSEFRSLKRIPKKSWLGGLCAGIAYSLGTPMWVVRAIWVLACLVSGVGILIYLVLWAFVPGMEEVPDDFKERVSDS